MKKFTVVLLSVIFVLVTGSIHNISADDSTDSEDTSMGKSDVATLTTSKDGKYLMHVQVIVRNAQGQLTAVTEGTYGAYLEHEVAANILITYLVKKRLLLLMMLNMKKLSLANHLKASIMLISGLGRVDYG